MSLKEGMAFSVNDTVVYGAYGVCEIQKISPLEGDREAQQTVYYHLKPLQEKGSMIYSPVDTEKCMIRRVITKQESDTLLDEIQDMELIKISNEKTLELEYKKAMQGYGCYSLMRVFKTVVFRKTERELNKRKVTAIDEKYLTLTKRLLCSELAISRGVPIDSIADDLYARLTAAESSYSNAG